MKGPSPSLFLLLLFIPISSPFLFLHPSSSPFFPSPYATTAQSSSSLHSSPDPSPSDTPSDATIKTLLTSLNLPINDSSPSANLSTLRAHVRNHPGTFDVDALLSPTPFPQAKPSSEPRPTLPDLPSSSSSSSFSPCAEVGGGAAGDVLTRAGAGSSDKEEAVSGLADLLAGMADVDGGVPGPADVDSYFDYLATMKSPEQSRGLAFNRLYVDATAADGFAGDDVEKGGGAYRRVAAWGGGEGERGEGGQGYRQEGDHGVDVSDVRGVSSPPPLRPPLAPSHEGSVSVGLLSGLREALEAAVYAATAERGWCVPLLAGVERGRKGRQHVAALGVEELGVFEAFCRDAGERGKEGKRLCEEVRLERERDGG
eukprot:CAMPEP_0182488934 /NCGR_PEP_ID=MMETSP1319-20130603/48654_1 /TAXON_ID=172717 /ORGANISM="Bolidomonas pacifica, Strain RCC208" /LENGTH=369 /DNA_ID=CAMNT_0024691059 /DNA_START=148 /DNA_END=1254 /DNA_ORIENTATION=+